jgi:hypothetical protein
MTNGLHLATVLAISGASLMIGACATAPTYEYVAPPLGSTWVNVQRNTGSYGTGERELRGSRGERTWQGKHYVTFDGTDQSILAGSDGAFHAFVRGDTPLMTFTPPLRWNYPLEVGKSWKKTYSMLNHATKQTTTYDVSQRVEAYGDVTVPAGTFKAFKITSSDSLGNENAQWIAPELGIFIKQDLVRTAKHPAGPGTRQTELVSQTIRK